MEKKKIVLLFRMNQPKKEQIKELCGQMGFRTEEITPMRYGDSLGSLAGLGEIATANSKIGSGTRPFVGQYELPAEMMVFYGLESAELDEFLKKYRQAGIEPVPIKAVVTPFNMQWTPYQLFNELMEEHRAMQGISKK